MRAVKIALLALVLAGMSVVAALAWLARSEPGSRWLLETALARLPFTVEVQQVSGTLLDGLTVAQLQITLPVAKIAAQNLRVEWQPAGLLAGLVMLDTVQIGALSVDVVPDSEPAAADPDPDRLFWLQLPVDVRINDGHLDALRVEQARFADIDVRGAIGWGRLRLDYIAGEIAGVHMRLRGELEGQDPGQLVAEGEWRWPAGKLSGAGRFNGNIDKLAVRHVVRIPDAISIAGDITDLFTEPALTGTAHWDSLQLAADGSIFSQAGNAQIRSDFVSLLISGKTILQLDTPPAMPLAIAAHANFDGVDVRGFRLDAFGGQVTGSGALDYRDGLSGLLNVTGRQLDTAALRADLPGRLDFAAQLQIASPAEIAVDVTKLTAALSGRTVTGNGRAQLRDGALASIAGTLNAQRSFLQADLELLPALRGTASMNVADLAGFYPGLQGALTARATLTGTTAKPRIRMTATGSLLELGALRATDLELDFNLAVSQQLAARLTVSGLASGTTELGTLQLQLDGTSSAHELGATLSGGVAELELLAAGGWDGKQLTERLNSGRIAQQDLGTWRLIGAPRLRAAADSVRLEAHCWRQQAASVCVGDSRRSASLLETSLELTRLPLATLAPWLPNGLGVEGVADASMQLQTDAAGWRGNLRWQQRGTQLTYNLDGEPVSTRIDSVDLALDSGPGGTTLDAAMQGDDGLALAVTAQLAAPASLDSALSSRITGLVPDIAILRPLLFRIVDAGEMEGTLKLDLTVSGTLRNPVFTGGAFLRDGLLQLPDAGVMLTAIELRATSSGSDVLDLDGSFRSGNGNAALGGQLFLTAEGQLRGALTVSGQNLRSVQLPELSLDSSPELTLRIDDNGIDISGTVVIPKAVARLRQLPATVAKKSADVVVHGNARPGPLLPEPDEKLVTADVEVILGKDVQFIGFGLEARLDGTLRLRQKRAGTLRGTGTVRVRNGFLMGYGKELRVDRGTLNFTGPLDDPGVNVQVSRNAIYEGRQYTIGLRLTGTARNVITTPFSNPAMSERDVLAFLLLDRPASTAGGDTDLSGAVLALGLGKMLPGGDDEGIIGRIGLDEISFEGAELEQTSVVAGKRINDDLYVRYVFGLFGEPGSFRIRYRLGRGFSVESSTGVNQAVDLIYVVEK